MFSRKGRKTTPTPKPTEEDERVSQRPYKQRPDSCTNTRSPLGCSWRDGERCSRLTEAELPGSGVYSLTTAFLVGVGLILLLLFSQGVVELTDPGRHFLADP